METLVYHNMSFGWEAGSLWATIDGWYLAFRELTAQELRDMDFAAKIDYIAMMADVDMEV